MLLTVPRTPYMAFTLLFPGEKQKIMKRVARKAVMDREFEGKRVDRYDFLKCSSPDNAEYVSIRKSYMRAKSQFEEGVVYDFYSMRKRFRRNTYPLSVFNRFTVIDAPKETEPYYTFKNGSYERAMDIVSYKTCPFCNVDFPENEINEHLEMELETERKNEVTVIFDRSIRTEYENLVFSCPDVITLKRLIYDRTGISVSKQDVYRGENLLRNADTLCSETVFLKQRKRMQRK